MVPGGQVTVLGKVFPDTAEAGGGDGGGGDGDGGGGDGFLL
jgi:hypothetical protein